MYRRNRPVAGFPVFLSPRRDETSCKSPKRAKRRRHPDRQSAARVVISLRWHDPNQVAGKDHGGLLSARQYGLPVVQFRLLYAPFPDFATVPNKKTGGISRRSPHRFAEMAFTGQPLAASKTRLSRLFSGAPTTVDTRPTMANTSGTAAAHIPQPMHRLSSILICMRLLLRLSGAFPPDACTPAARRPELSSIIACTAAAPQGAFSAAELFYSRFVSKKGIFTGEKAWFVSGLAFTLSFFCAILKNVMLTTP